MPNIHDPWVLPGDVPPLWHSLVLRRARDIGQTLPREARWALFATQSVAHALRSGPGGAGITQILLLGPLANGVVLGPISLLIAYNGAFAAHEFEALNRALATSAGAARHEYGLTFELLAVSAFDADDPSRWPPQWEVMRDDVVRIWPEPR